jgi:thiol-activated cytolysin
MAKFLAVTEIKVLPRKELKIIKKKKLRVAPKFKFKVLPKKIIHAGSIGLKGGGSIKIEAGRNMNDFGKIVPIQGSGKTEESGNWTCQIQRWDAEIINKDTAILNPQLTKIYVGGVYDFTQIANGSLNTVPYPRKPITLVSDNNNAKKAQVVVNTPTAGNVQSAILELIGGAKPGGTRTTGTTFEMLSEEDFFMRTGGSGYYLGFGGSHEFNFKDTKKSHKYVVEVFQTYYTIFVDDSVHEPQDFFHIKGESQKDDAIAAEKIDPNWVYVDSVSYGRMLYLVYESDYSFSEFGIDVNIYANIGFAGGEASLNEKQKKVMQSTSLTVGAVGGNPIFSGLLSNPSSFKDLQKRIDNYFKQTNDEAKIAFTLSTLDQATVGARMITNYTSRQCAPRASKYRITWNKVVNSVNDDSGSGSEIKAFVRIAANGNGKFIMDVEKKNKALGAWVDSPAAAQKIVPKPWTFTEGSSANPLELQEGAAWNVNKRIDFNVPLQDANAKIAIRVDVVEFDDTSGDDHFVENYWESKITELSDVTHVNLVSRHEGSRITFMLTVEAIYEN